MKRINNTFQVLLVAAVLLLISCNGENSSKSRGTSGQVETGSESPVLLVGEETQLLLDYLAEQGDIVNSRDFPSFITAAALYELLDSNTLVIDLRQPDDYSAGHIRGAVNVSFNDLPAFFGSDPGTGGYSRVAITCSDGQASAYATSLLRLQGYNNVYSLKWGMSSWNSSTAERGWAGALSSGYQDRLETGDIERKPPYRMPELNTGKNSGGDIAAERFRKLFAEDISSIFIEPGELFTNPGEYFVINYDRRDKYESGHIPGAMRYKPGSTLGFVEEMSTIDPEARVVTYCSTGQNAGYVTAYLRLMGYDAYSLNHGNNGFMYDRMVAEQSTLSWTIFTPGEVNDFPLEKATPLN